MKTQIQDKNQEQDAYSDLDDKINSRLNKNPKSDLDLEDKINNRLNKNPKRAASILVFILLIAFAVFIFNTFNRIKNPKPIDKINLRESVNRNFNDSISGNSVSDDFLEILMLKEIQKEIDLMKKNPEKIDTARMNQLIELLK